MHRFLSQPSTSHRQQNKKQIISLGAGSDTRVFRLLPSHPDLIYHEIDFAVNTAAKIRFIRAAPHLQRALGIIGGPAQESGFEISEGGDALHTKTYHLHPLDLRDLKPTTKSKPDMTGSVGSNGQEKAQDNGNGDPQTYLRDVDPTLPTLLISECCLIYLSPREAADVVDFFTQTLFPGASNSGHGNGTGSPLGLILYEPIRPHDAFGRTMVSNLATRGIQLQTLHQYATLESQRQRLRQQGLVDGQAAADVHFIWERWVSEAEKERVAGLEMLDEMEEWNLLAQHYCIAWGWRDGLTGEFGEWKNFDSQQGVDS